MDYNNINEVIADIKKNREAIVDDYNNKRPYAESVITYLRLHVSSPYDPCAQGLLMSAYKDYKNSKKS